MDSNHTLASDHPLPRWQAVGLARQIPQHGDYLTAHIDDEPLVVLRNAEGEPRALSRVCRHRGFDMLEGTGPSDGNLSSRAGKVKRLSCPYHAWTYNLDGRLIGAPSADGIPGFDKSCVALPAFDLAELQGVLFVCVSSPAPDLESQLESEGTSAQQIYDTLEASLDAGEKP